MLLAFGFASPAFADNGPHQSTTNVMNVDRCAGCHRAHTASASYLLTQSESALCQTCHGAAAGGSTLDVADGVAYGSTGGTGPTGPAGQARIPGDQTGALRGGGFTKALLSSGPGGVVSRALSSDGHGLVPALGATSGGVSVTSTHNTGVSGTAWGAGGYIGATGATGAGTAVTLQCGSCHDPHGGANAGYGTYRILKVNPNTGVMVGQVSSMTAAASGVVTINSVAATGVKQNQIITLTGTNVAAFNTTYQVLSTPAGTAISAQAVTVNSRSGAIATKTLSTATAYTSGGAILTSAGVLATVSAAVVNAPVNSNPPTVTYSVSDTAGVVAGQVVTITGINGVTASGGLNVSGQITSVGAGTITVQGNPGAAAPSGTYGPGGWVTLSNTAIQDSTTKSYATANYWAQDDIYNAQELARDSNGTSAGTTVTSLENNISRWCTTCHTRLLAGSGSWSTPLTAGGTTDAMYAFRHRSDANTKTVGTMGDSPNCLTCHVSHGSNASMSGQYSGAIGNPDGTSNAPDSFLLRVDNRGTCQMCHNK
ncbi:MAG TPA: cytochrome c3 family protein [Mycobacterium sp.]